MKGIGIDIITLSRMDETVQRSGNLFLKRTFSEKEQQTARASENANKFFASAFAAKEAVFKALGWEQDIDFREIEVSRGSSGEPLVNLCGTIGARASAKGFTRVLLSLSYETNLAVAMAVVT